MKKIILLLTALLTLTQICNAQWTTSGSNIYNSNTGNVGIGINPSYLLGSPLQVGSIGATTYFYSLTQPQANIIGPNITLSPTAMGNLNISGNSSNSTTTNLGFGASLTFTQNISQFAAGYEKVIGAVKGYLSTTSNGVALGSLGFYTNNNSTLTERMTLNSGGNLGIGTTTPLTALHISAASSASATAEMIENTVAGAYGANTVYKNTAQQWMSGMINAAAISRYSIYDVTNSTERLVVLNNGNIGIGITNPLEKLAVNGTIHSKAVIVDLLGWSDYVFNSNYRLAGLSDVKTYIDKNHHLPDMPSEAEIVKTGLNLGDMNKLLTKKVEELTLYAIGQENQVKEQQAALCSQQQQIADQEQRLKLLETKLNQLLKATH
ncbi:hypothetical protein BH09BAC6_BH09BAC6_30140 [soil metagenome]|jgi:hypothetical protein